MTHGAISEDCLFVNVWMTKLCATAKLPVYAFLSRRRLHRRLWALATIVATTTQDRWVLVDTTIKN